MEPSSLKNVAPGDRGDGSDTGAEVMQPAATISIVTLFLNADIVVKGVLLLLLVASVWSWAVILDKLWRLGAVSRSARAHEERALTARSPAELWTQAADTRDPAGQVLIAGL